MTELVPPHHGEPENVGAIVERDPRCPYCSRPVWKERLLGVPHCLACKRPLWEEKHE